MLEFDRVLRAVLQFGKVGLLGRVVGRVVSGFEKGIRARRDGA